MSISTDHTQLQRPLYLLDYPQPLPSDATALVTMLLKDMQAALERVRELEAQSTQLEREVRTNRATMSKLKTEIRSLRTENNTLRSEVLNYTRELGQATREQRTRVYETEKKVDGLHMAQLRMKAECAESQRLLDECQKELAKSGGNGRPQGPDRKERYTKLEATGLELRAAQLEVKERDLELMRLNSELERQAPLAANISDSRLADQVNHIHERAEQLERENKEVRKQFAKEKDELHKRWAQTENKRAQLADNNNNKKKEVGGDFERIKGIVQRLRDSHPSTRSLPDELQNELEGLPRNSSNGLPNNIDDGEIERLRTEHGNTKSLYAQIRDQLQELLKSGNADLHYLREQSRKSENKLRTDMEEEHEQLQKRISKLAEFEVIAQQHESTLRECQRLVEQYSKVDQSLCEALREVSESCSRISRLEHKVSDLTQHLSDHKMLSEQNTNELKSRRRTLDAYKSDMETMQQARETTKREAEGLKAELSQLTRLRDALEMAKDEYKVQLVKSLKENEAHRGLTAHLMAERDVLRAQVKARFHLNQQLEQQLQGVEHRDGPLWRTSGSLSAHSSRFFAQSNLNAT
ncbi:hypothetical protein GGI26_006251 [Coemansia sp. RSA 1358]|nr:hypothetical protein GGI26_006251 [Coemansia sp. RSA 1358]